MTRNDPTPSEDPNRYWFPREPLGHRIQWLLLLFSTFTILTNAYFLRFAEDAVSRKLLAYIAVAVTGLWMLIRRYGAPRSLAQITRLLRRYSTAILLSLIVAIAFALRLSGISYGLPQSYIPDEYDFVHSYLQMLKRGDLNPNWWFHPSLKSYVNVVTYVVVYLINVPKGVWSSVHQLTVEDMLYWGRFAAGVIPGTAVVLVSFFMGRRLYGTGVGLIAAALLAVFPGTVEVSQYNKPDALLTLMSAVSVLVILNYLERGRGALAFSCGVAIGLTVAAKYNGALVLLPFLLAVLFRRGHRFLAAPDLYLGAAGSFLGFFIGCPYFMADLPRFLNNLSTPMFEYGYLGRPGAEGVDNWYTHARYAALYGTGILTLLAGLGGLGLALYRLERATAVFLAFPVLYYSFFSSQKIIFPGNLMPVYPFIAILAAYAIHQLASVSASLLQEKLKLPSQLSARPVLLTGLLVATLWFPIDMSLQHNRAANMLDTGTYAARWIEDEFPPGTHFAVERHTIVLDPDRYQITMESRIINRAVRDYRAQGVQYLIVSSIVYQRYGPDRRQTQNYQKLFNICPQVAEFKPEEGKLVGPTLRILRVPPEPTKES